MATKQNNHHRWIALLIALLALSGSTCVLWLSVWEHGTVLRLYDSFMYMRTGMSMYHDLDLTTNSYKPVTDTIVSATNTHYPPFVAFLYSIGMAAGIPSYLVPSVISLIGWIFLLVGTGILTYRLGKSPIIAALAVVLASLTYSYWWLFQTISAEIVFLPLLVWLMIVLVDLPYRQANRMRWLALASLLLAILMITRYVGVVVFAAVSLWWVWHWWSTKPRDIKILLKEGGGLAAALIPPGLWVLFNTLSSSHLAGQSHFSQSDHSLHEGVAALFRESTHLLIPGMYYPRLMYILGALNTIILYIIVFFAAIGILWYCAKLKIFSFGFSRTPLLVFVLFYLALYTLVQPLMSFSPLDRRDATSIFCLIQPFVFGVLASTRRTHRWVVLLLIGYVTFNGVLGFGEPFAKGFPEWVETSPPHFESLAGQNLSEHPELYGYGIFLWVRVQPGRTADLVHYHSDLYTWLKAQPSPRVILTNAPVLVTSYQLEAVGNLMNRYRYSPWLEKGSCTSDYSTILVTFDEDYLPYAYDWIPNEKQKEVASLREAIEAKCPDLPRYTFQHSVVYKLHPAPLDNLPNTSHD